MGVNTKFLFAFDRSLPSPYDTRKSKKVKISSTYGDGLEATLSCSFIKAIHAYLRCIDGSGQGALGELDGRSIVEYKSALAPGAYHLVVYDAASGNIMASVYDQDSDLMEVYELNGKGRDGSAVNMALLPSCSRMKSFGIRWRNIASNLPWDCRTLMKQRGAWPSSAIMRTGALWTRLAPRISN